jgi:hypothetical protein
MSYTPSEIRENPALLKEIVNPSKEQCLAAVQQRVGNNLKHIPEFMRDAEICMEAAKANGYAIQHMTEKQRTCDIWITAVQRDPAVFSEFPILFPEDSESNEKWMKLFEIAVKGNGLNLKHIPPSCINADLIHWAVEQNGWAIQYVPRSFAKTQELCLKAIQKNPGAIKYCEQTDTLIWEALKAPLDPICCFLDDIDLNKIRWNDTCLKRYMELMLQFQEFHEAHICEEYRFNMDPKREKYDPLWNKDVDPSYKDSYTNEH